MFINELNKSEAVAFVNLVKKLAEVDCVFAIEEDKLINEYIEELGIPKDSVSDLSLEDALKVFDGSEQKNKNIVYFELLGIALVDGDFDREEIKFINFVAKELKITKDKQDGCLNYFKEVKNIYDNSSEDYEKHIRELEKKALEIVG